MDSIFFSGFLFSCYIHVSFTSWFGSELCFLAYLISWNWRLLFNPVTDGDSLSQPSKMKCEWAQVSKYETNWSGLTEGPRKDAFLALLRLQLWSQSPVCKWPHEPAMEGVRRLLKHTVLYKSIRNTFRP